MAFISEAFNTYEVKVVFEQYPTGICDCGHDLNSNHQKSHKICDNGCGTNFCSSCNNQYHMVNNVLVKGHSKTCGRPATRKYDGNMDFMIKH